MNDYTIIIHTLRLETSRSILSRNLFRDLVDRIREKDRERGKREKERESSALNRHFSKGEGLRLLSRFFSKSTA